MVEKYLNSLVSCHIHDKIPDYMYLRPKQEESQDFWGFREKLEERVAKMEQTQKSADRD